MRTLTVTAKGQVTLRKELLDHLGIEPGQKISVEKLADGGLSVHAERKTGQISDLVGMLKRPGQPCLSIDEINEAISEGWAGKR
jgi:bifunctional DNA-binding transcriptional regulator/antitoxin component of YhaV-PrlF toxin-antitoxin module